MCIILPLVEIYIFRNIAKIWNLTAATDGYYIRDIKYKLSKIFNSNL